MLKPKNTIWNPHWDNQRIKEEMAFLWSKKKQRQALTVTNRPLIGGVRPAFTKYVSQLSDGTEVTFEVWNVGSQFGVQHTNFIPIISITM